MLKKLTLTTILAATLAAPAFAGLSPALRAEVDAVLATASPSEADVAKVTELRAMGEAQHAASDHASSEASLAEAKALLVL